MTRSSARAKAFVVANLVGALLAGSILRVHRLGDQALTGDEWHSLRAASEMGYWHLVTSMRPGAHYSVPEALLFRTLSALFDVSELLIYAPYVITGLVTIVAIPSLLATTRFAGSLTVLPWLIALSPTFIIYSRYARPYGPVALFAILAILAFVEWEKGRRTRDLVAYTCFAALATYLHVVSLPFVYAPLAAHVLRSLRHRELMPDTAKAVLVAVTPTILLTGIPLARNPVAVTEKMGAATYTFSSVTSGLAVTLGSPELWIAGIILVIGALGGVATWRRNELRPLLYHLAFASAVQLLTILVSQPVAGQGPHIFARYAIPVSLFALMLTSAGLSTMTHTVASRASLRALLVVIILGAFIVHTTRTAGLLSRHNSQVNLSILGYLIWGADAPRTITKGLSSRTHDIYERLGSTEPQSLTLLELPYKANDIYLPTRQLIHRQRVAYGYTDGSCGRPLIGEAAIDLGPTLARLKLRHTLPVPPRVDLWNRFDLVIVHPDLSKETTYRPQFGPYTVEACVGLLESRFGPPVLEGDGLVVFATSERGRASLNELAFRSRSGG